VTPRGFGWFNTICLWERRERGITIKHNIIVTIFKINLSNMMTCHFQGNGWI